VPAPRVSILLPVRDAASTLERCLRSLAAQTLPDHEVVVVDDGSRDDSGQILEAAAARDPRLRVWRTPARGLVAALNAAAQQARAPILARMDADDVSLPERLARQWQRLQEPGAPDVLGTRVRLRCEDGEPTSGMTAYVDWQNRLIGHEAILRDLYVESPLVHPSAAFPAAALRTLGGYRDFDGPEDYDLWLRAARAGMRFGKEPEVLLEWWDSPSRLTRASARYAAERFFALKAEAVEQVFLRPSRPVVIWGAGPIGKGWSRELRARGHEVVAFVEVAPRKIGERIHEVPVMAVEDAAGLGPALHLAAVGQPGARAAIREAAARIGVHDGIDLVAVA
jgi:glycosyltransferase involved in cell wall biosynthesis